MMTPEELDLRLDYTSMASWVATVLRLSYVDIPLDGYQHGNPIPYVNWLQLAFGNGGRWILIMENSPKNIFHAHCMICTIQRTDNCSRCLKNAGKQLCEQSSYNMKPEILKASSCKSGRGMLCYMLKNPCHVICSNLDDVNTCYNVRQQGLHMPYKQKSEQREMQKTQQLEAQKQSNINPDTGNDLTTYCLTHMINAGKTLTLEEICTRDPEGMKKYLHRPNLSKILSQCSIYYQATRNTWSPFNKVNWSNNTKDHRNIHAYLIYQNIDTASFDNDCFLWLYKQHTKKNTLVLQGPSNTGKSSFIKGLIEALGSSVGYICNGTFPFQGMAKPCTIGVWEEPLLSSTEAEKAKQILGGEPTSVAVKFAAPVHVERTPILITTNHELWRYCTQEKEALLNRCFIYKCTTRIRSNYTAESQRSPDRGCYCGCGSGSRDSEESSNISSTNSSSSDSEQHTRRRSSSTSSNSSSRSGSSVSYRYGNASCETNVGWSHYRITGANIVSSTISSTYSSGHHSSSSATTDHDYGSSGNNRSSNTGNRVDNTTSAEFVDRYGKRRRCFRGNIGKYGSLARLGGSLLGRRRNTKTNIRSRRRSKKKQQTSQLVDADPVLGGDSGSDQVEEQPEVGRKTTATHLSIPTADEWKAYCGYLCTTFDYDPE